MNQTDFSAIGGVTKKTQLLYESGERFPSADYLEALFKSGVDIQFVITGIQSGGSIVGASTDAVRTAARSAFEMVNASKIKINPDQFAQMVITLLPEISMAASASEDEQSPPTTSPSHAKKLKSN
ncbi:hypothetical protein [Paraherbaspirillum soli]|uniref:XRE family transcriptional regulator n=1 Tax=Paraherbaspirillum soli TaxID=631222 RepID=A0ABW0M9U6_9BURK